MHLRAVLFLLICFTSYAQPITIKMDAVTANDSVPDSREFNLKYRVINNTSDTLKLFLTQMASLQLQEVQLLKSRITKFMKMILL
jgi:hypothetical protein